MTDNNRAPLGFVLIILSVVSFYSFLAGAAFLYWLTPSFIERGAAQYCLMDGEWIWSPECEK